MLKVSDFFYRRLANIIWRGDHYIIKKGSVTPLPISYVRELAFMAHMYPERKITLFSDGHMTFRSFLRAIDNVTTSLSDLGMKAGDRIRIELPLHEDHLLLFYVADRLGLVITKQEAKMCFFHRQMQGQAPLMVDCGKPSFRFFVRRKTHYYYLASMKKHESHERYPPYRSQNLTVRCDPTDTATLNSLLLVHKRLMEPFQSARPSSLKKPLYQ